MGGIFAISDLHLPTHIQINKFGYPADYFEQVREHLLKFNPDLLLIVGDFSYESNFRRGLSILEAIEELAGSKKVFIEVVFSELSTLNSSNIALFTSSIESSLCFPTIPP